MPAKCVSVDSENGTFWKRWRHNSHVTLSQSLLNHWSKMAAELLIMNSETVWKRLMFADDTNLLYADKDSKSLESVINIELQKVCDW